MRVLGDIPGSEFKITLFAWNQKYILKIEDEMYEQTFKVSELDLTSENEVKEILTEEFLESIRLNFKNMHEAFSKSLSKINDFENE